MFFRKSQDIGIDLGTASILVYTKDQGIVVNEPSVVAIETATKRLIAVGLEAQRMLGRTPDEITVIRPLRDGVISDYESTELMIRFILDKVCKKSFFKPRVVVCVPSIVTEVEKKAVIDATTGAGARMAYLIEEPIAAAIGAGLDIARPNGNMVVDVGGGTTDIAVLSLGSMVVHDSIKIAGDEFDQAIIRYIRKRHNVIIGEATAGEVKKAVGCVYPVSLGESVQVRGRSLLTGLPTEVTVTSAEMLDALREEGASIVEAVKGVLEQTPPELIGDISTNGILLTGGGAMITGLDRLLSAETGLDVQLAEDPITCVVKGTGRSLRHLRAMTGKK
ncbi:MAG: rod shape-determining protein [Ruminococcaceae bacterium]|nr:rod shape-determining protein [Oscillospiraceae bacterium]